MAVMIEFNGQLWQFRTFSLELVMTRIHLLLLRPVPLIPEEILPIEEANKTQLPQTQKHCSKEAHTKLTLELDTKRETEAFECLLKNMQWSRFQTTPTCLS